MKKQVSKDKIKSKKNISKEMYKAVPDEIKVAFGKFYLFSLVYIVFFSIIYPFLLIKYMSDFTCGLVVGFLTVFYIYIIRDTKRKVKTFSSTFYYLLILGVFLSISFSIVKYFI